MILTVEKQDIQTNTQNNASMDFKIESNSVMMQMLRKDIYSNPVVACVRELLSNCKDAMVRENRQHIPCEIFFVDDSIIFKDTGTGISPEVMDTVYRWYGRSTKRNTVEELGKWGLGCKVGFAISSTFIIETIYDGVKYLYNAYIDESLVGKIVLLHESPTTERNGTSIKIPIQSHQKSEFRTAVREITRFWSTPPLIHGELPETPLVPSLEGRKWVIYNKDVSPYNILLGELPYKNTNYNIQIPRKVVLKFEISELEVTVDRDNLQYTEMTKQNIQLALDEYQRDIISHTQAKIDKEQDFSKVINLINDMKGSLTNQQADLEWKWQDETFHYPLLDGLRCYEKTYGRWRSYSRKTFDFSQTTFIFLDKDFPNISSYDKQKFTYLMREHDTDSICLIDQATLDSDTLPKPFTQNLKKLSEVKIIQPKPATTVGNIGGTPARAARLPKKQTVRVKLRSYKKVYRYELDRTNAHPTELLYVTSGLDNLSGINYLPKKIVQVLEGDESKLVGQPGWISLDDFLQQEIHSKYTQAELQDIVDKDATQTKNHQLKFLAGFHPDFAILKDVGKEDPIQWDLINFLKMNGKLTPQVRTFSDKYPLLQYLSGYHYTDKDFQQKVKDYVTLVNQQRTNTTTSPA